MLRSFGCLCLTLPSNGAQTLGPYLLLEQHRVTCGLLGRVVDGFACQRLLQLGPGLSTCVRFGAETVPRAQLQLDIRSEGTAPGRGPWSNRASGKPGMV